MIGQWHTGAVLEHQRFAVVQPGFHPDHLVGPSALVMGELRVWWFVFGCDPGH